MRPRQLPLTDADREAWAEYETRNEAAHEQYLRMPISLNMAGPAHPCAGCGEQTKAVGVCKACRGAS